MQIQQRQHLADLRGSACPRRQDRRGKPLPLTGIRIHPPVGDPRRPHRDRTRGRQHLTLVVVPIADHKPTAVVIELIGELLHIRSHLGPQRGGQHLSG